MLEKVFWELWKLFLAPLLLLSTVLRHLRNNRDLWKTLGQGFVTFGKPLFWFLKDTPRFG